MGLSIQWFAKGGGIAKIGPFESQIAATEAIRYAEPVNGQFFPIDAFVWPENAKVVVTARKK